MTTRTSILLVDDDSMVRQALEQALAAENYFVVPAANRDEALRQLEKHPIDILLVDLHPWKEDGRET
jgi:DNA-binding response OmpR family regulator